MRIIGGKFKGKKIYEPSDKNTRPLKDMVKESIFNILHHSKKAQINIEKSNILDLFSGIGSFGLDAISRGASHVTFVENYNNVIPILKKNIDNLNFNKNCSVLNIDIFKDLEFKNFKKNFDLIFLDPPFKEKSINNIIKKIFKSKILKKKGIIIIHRHNKECDIFLNEFKIAEQKKYGNSKIIFGYFTL